ncbi:MAG TPA: adenylate/guanylate cyclase domain-containing protein [Bacteroidia bacterium]|nr:adenylate/guanylate cyclase domain-containing protein [Bacteroidia bacterium]
MEKIVWRKLFLIFVMMNLFLPYSYSQKGKELSAHEKKQAIIDSLLILLPKAPEDTNKVKLYHNILHQHVYYNNEAGLKYEKSALELAEKLNWKIGVAGIKNVAGRVYWRMGKFDDALKRHFEALYLYTEVKDEVSSAISLSFIGQDYADAGKYEQALIFFKRALKKYEASGNKERIVYISYLLAWVYDNLGNYVEVSKLNYAILKQEEELGDKYRIAIALANVANDYFTLGNYPEALTYNNKAIKLLLEINEYIALSGCYINIGAIYKITANYPEAIKNYSTALQLGEKIKDRFVIASACGGLGDVYQAQNNFSEALKYYNLGIENLKSIDNKQELAELYSKSGICYARLKLYADAKRNFDKALALSKELGSNVSFTFYYQGKEILDSATGSWENAYKNYKRYIVLRDSTFNKDNLTKMLSSQMQYEAEKKEAIEKAERERKEAIAKAEQEKKDIRQRTIRNSIAAVLAGSLIFLVVVYRQRNKIAKARKRSDELLLNILPAEVAEELKDKGSADAKHFDEVTVLFTDFKGFTQLSEKLTPVELVAEINECFSAFDHIMQKHGVEKIKTIGDAYMAAGGIPTPNKTHAVDVVKAALDIQQFMHEHKAKREAASKLFFEIRIGIHTGTVVAGIVGVKKFAYDIWGDTVNTASRMESSGEVGMINISGTTYELVKDKFNCIHRGKITAKGKGEIDMYFVEEIS